MHREKCDVGPLGPCESTEIAGFDQELADVVQRSLLISLREAGDRFPHVLAARDRELRRQEQQAEAVGDQVEQVGGD